MKATAVLTALFLATAGLMLAAETPAAVAAKDACCAEKPVVEKAACCAETAASAAKQCGCACCAEKPAAKKDACCTEPAAPKPDAAPKACCAANTEVKPTPCCPPSGKIENPESKIENSTQESLYQLEVTFTDDTGKTVALGDLRGRPVVLDMFFASCGYACPLTVSDMLAIQGRLPAEQRARAVFVLVSFDIARDTTAVLAKYREQRALDGQWVLLRGTDDAVRELAALLGVKYKQEADGMFSHSNVVTVLNGEGEIVHQRLGLKGGLDEAVAAIAAVK